MLNRSNACLASLGAALLALYLFFDQRQAARRALATLLLLHSCLLAYSAWAHSPTLNEPGHLVAGISHWRFSRFELYRVNPPLVRMVAAIPVLALGCEEDWSQFYDAPGARPVFRMGERFLAANEEGARLIFMVARWACIPFSWLGALTCYMWARDIYGRPSGLIACALWCFSPTVLAHASLLTADAHAASIGLAACYGFWRWLKEPTWARAIVTGIILGLAELSKSTLLVLYPLWPLIWLVYRYGDRATMKAKDWMREAGMLLLRMAIALYVLNLGYGFDGTFLQLKDYKFVSDLFRGLTEGEAWRAASSYDVTNGPIGGWLGYMPIPLPEQYLLGIDVQQREFEHVGRVSYLRGQWREHGWWYYYLYAACIKLPLGTWVLASLTMLSYVTDHNRLPKLLSRKDELVLLSPAIAIFVTVSAKSGINDHFRYILPALPFAFVWIAKFPAPLLTAAATLAYTTPIDGRSQCRSSWLSCVYAGAICWFVTSSLWIYPHSLSYFNESVGGPLGGPSHLLGSNVDWGQDLWYAESWARQRSCVLLCGRAYGLYGRLGLLDGVTVVYPSDLQSLEGGCVVASVNDLLVCRPDGDWPLVPVEFGPACDRRARIEACVTYSLRSLFIGEGADRPR